MNIFRKLFHIASWIPFVLLMTFPLLMVYPFADITLWQAFLPVGAMFLGVVFVPIAIATRGQQSEDWPFIFWLWGNDEEGCPDWWFRVAENKGGFIAKFPAFWWYAVRNPVNNRRFIFKDREAKIDGWEGPMEAQNLIDAGVKSATRWAYSGFFAGYRRVWLKKDNKYGEFWIGWKVGSTVPGLAFTMQLRRNAEIGQ